MGCGQGQGGMLLGRVTSSRQPAKGTLMTSSLLMPPAAMHAAARQRMAWVPGMGKGLALAVSDASRGSRARRPTLPCSSSTCLLPWLR